MHQQGSATMQLILYWEIIGLMNEEHAFSENILLKPVKANIVTATIVTS